MDLQLESKRALVTGSTAGIGFAIAEVLAREGASVMVNGRTEKRVQDALKKLRDSGSGGKVEALAADLGGAGGVRKAIELFPAVDILVNNLGIFEVKPFQEISDDDQAALFRSKCPERCPFEPALFAGDDRAKMGTHRRYL